MARIERSKRVTNQVDDKLKSRITGIDRYPMSYVSSGSEHDGVDDGSPSLSDLVQGFFEEDDVATELILCSTNSQSVRVESDLDSVEMIEYMLNPSVTNNADSVRNVLRLHVLKALEIFSCLRSNKAMFRRNVMSYLRNIGYNAAICKTNWQSSGGLTAGNYEYIDVIASQSSTSRSQNRYIIDIDFAGQFEIARPTSQHTRFVQALPRVFVGRGEEVKKIVKVMCDSAKRSLKSKELHFPPWRKSRFMMMKWFSPYRRTTKFNSGEL